MDKVAFFLGKWRGKGVVLGVSKSPLTYLEETTFTLLRSEPAILINLQQYTKHAESGAPMHSENGFVKILPPKDGLSVRSVEMMLSHPFSLNEFEYGTYDGESLKVESSKPEHFQRGMTAKGKQTTGFRREYWLNDKGNLCYKMFLGVDGAEPYEHLNGELEPV